MKYMKPLILGAPATEINILVDEGDGRSTLFPAVIDNPAYDQFLVQVDLTDEEVHALPVDEWFEV